MDETITHETLQAEIGALRVLARSLVRDENDADDLVQHAALQALRSDPPQFGRLRNWLSAVARNFHIQRRREEVRRRDREKRVARSEAVRDDTEAVERFEILRRVVSAVDGLEEPYRSTIVLRYFEDISSREIAARHGVPLATARTRLRRGIEKLRAVLDANHPGGRAAWTALLQPLAAGTTTSSTVITAGIAWMQTKHKVALLALVLVAVGGLVYPILSGKDDADPTTSDVTRTTAGERAAANDAAPGSTAGESTGAEIARAEDRGPLHTPHVVLAGQVVTRAVGEPCPGVTVAVEVIAGTTVNATPSLRLAARTDPGGAFEAVFPVPEKTSLVNVVSDSKSFWFRSESLFLRAGQTSVAPMTIEAVPLNVTIRGSVVDQNGRAIAGTSVRSSGMMAASVTPDAKGEFEMQVASQRVHKIWASADGFGIVGWVTQKFAPGADVRHDFVLEPGWRITGQVVDEGNAPVEGAEVMAVHSSWQTTRTDSGGHFLLAHFPKAMPYQVLRVRHPEFEENTMKVLATDSVRSQVVRLTRGVEVSGIVVGPDDRPLEAIPIYLRGDALVNRNAEAVSGPDGRFRLFSSPDWGKLCAWGGGFAPAFVELDLRSRPDDARDLVVRLTKGSRLRGRVVDAGGRPLRGVHVSVTIGKEELDSYWNNLGGVARTDAAGRFDAGDLPSSILTVGFSRRGYVSIDRELVPVKDIEVVMVEEAGLAGHVVDGRTGESVRKFVVRIFWKRGADDSMAKERWGPSWSRIQLVEDDNGYWTTMGDASFHQGLKLGVEIRADGFASVVHTGLRTRQSPRPQDLETRLMPGGTVTGLVRDADTGAPIGGARVTVYPPELSIGAETTDSDLAGHVYTNTGEDGRFRLGDTGVGKVSLVVKREGYAVRILRDVAVEASAVASMGAIELNRGKRITVRWKDAKGRSFDRARVRLETVGVPAETGRVTHARTDTEGVVSFVGLNPGRYLLVRLEMARRFTEGVFTQPIVIGDEPEQEFTVSERLGTARLFGRVTSDPNYADEIGIQIVPTTNPDAGPSEWFVLVRDGSFELLGLPKGEYSVQPRRVRGVGSRANPGGGLGPSRTLEIRGPTRLDFSLPAKDRP